MNAYLVNGAKWLRAGACLGMLLVVALAVGCGDKGSWPRSVPSGGGPGSPPAQRVVYAPPPAVYIPPSPPIRKVNKAALQQQHARLLAHKAEIKRNLEQSPGSPAYLEALIRIEGKLVDVEWALREAE